MLLAARLADSMPTDRLVASNFTGRAYFSGDERACEYFLDQYYSIIFDEQFLLVLYQFLQKMSIRFEHHMTTYMYSSNI